MKPIKNIEYIKEGNFYNSSNVYYNKSLDLCFCDNLDDNHFFYFAIKEKEVFVYGKRISVINIEYKDTTSSDQKQTPNKEAKPSQEQSKNETKITREIVNKGTQFNLFGGI